MREPLYSLACENFSRFHQQDEHNASYFYKSAVTSFQRICNPLVLNWGFAIPR